MCGHHPNLVKVEQQGPVTPVFLSSEVEFYTLLPAVNGGYHKETGRRVPWTTHLCVVYKVVHLKSILASHSVKMCPLLLSQKFPMTFGLGTVPRGKARKWVDISLVLPVKNFFSLSEWMHTWMTFIVFAFLFISRKVFYAVSPVVAHTDGHNSYPSFNPLAM